MKAFAKKGAGAGGAFGGGKFAKLKRAALKGAASADSKGGAIALLKLGKAALEAGNLVAAAEKYTKLCAHKHVGDMAGKAQVGLADAYWAMWERSAERDFSDGACYEKDALAAEAARAAKAYAKMTASASLLAAKEAAEAASAAASRAYERSCAKGPQDCLLLAHEHYSAASTAMENLIRVAFWRRLAACYCEAGAYEGGVAVLSRCIEDFPKAPSRHRTILETAGVLSQGLAMHREAAQYLNNVAATAKDRGSALAPLREADLLLVLAHAVYRRAGNRKFARAGFEQAYLLMSAAPPSRPNSASPGGRKLAAALKGGRGKRGFKAWLRNPRLWSRIGEKLAADRHFLLARPMYEEAVRLRKGQREERAAAAAKTAALGAGASRGPAPLRGEAGQLMGDGEAAEEDAAGAREWRELARCYWFTAEADSAVAAATQSLALRPYRGSRATRAMLAAWSGEWRALLDAQTAACTHLQRVARGRLACLRVARIRARRDVARNTALFSDSRAPCMGTQLRPGGSSFLPSAFCGFFGQAHRALCASKIQARCFRGPIARRRVAERRARLRKFLAKAARIRRRVRLSRWHARAALQARVDFSYAASQVQLYRDASVWGSFC